MFGLKKKKQGNRKVEPVRNLKQGTVNKHVKPFAIATMICLVLVSLVVAQKHLSQKILFPITDVVIANELKQAEAQTVQGIILNDLEHGFFDIKLNELASKIENLDWVAEVNLRRVWPNSVEVLITEHQAVAIWDESTLMSDEGILFNVPNSNEFKLATIHGQQAMAKDLLEAYKTLEQLSNTYGLHIEQLNSMKSGEVVVRFNSNLTTVFALQDQQQQFERFQSLLSTGYLNIQNNSNELNNKAISRLDMRYSNGFSVVWQEEPQSHLMKQANQLENGNNNV